MRISKYYKVLFVSLLIVLILPSSVFASVHINYPGIDFLNIISEDRDLPGQASNNREDYVNELIEWGMTKNIYLSREDAEKYIDLPTPIIISENG